MSDFYQLPELPYAFDALEPVLSAELLEIHYKKHHQAYVTNLNVALEKYAEAKKKQDLASMVVLQSAIQFNGGGHLNHSFFWSCLAPQSQGGGVFPQTGAFREILEKNFGSFERFVEKFNLDALSIQGSGWCWLGYHPVLKHLDVLTTQNHGTLAERRWVPLLVVDIWEHAYYLQYKNGKADFLNALWKIFNWNAIENRYEKVIL